MSYITNTFENEKYKIEIIQDRDSESPRDSFDNLGTMAFLGTYRHIGDKHNYDNEELNEIEANDNIISLPVYGYSHGGLTISVKPFNCSWDSGKLGIIFIDKDDLKKHGLENSSEEDIKKYLTSEVKTLDDWITGEVYGFEIYEKEIYRQARIDKNNNIIEESIVEKEELNLIESCYGFYGEDIMKNGIIDYFNKECSELVKENLQSVN